MRTMFGKPRWLVLLLFGILILTVVDGLYLVYFSLNATNDLVHANYKRQDYYQEPEGPVISVIKPPLKFIEGFFESHEKALLVCSTIVIAGFTVALWRATSGLFVQAKNQAEKNKSANAAAKSAAVAEQSLKKIERPQLLLTFEKRNFRPFRDSTDIIHPTEPRQYPDVAFSLCNFGRQVAILRDMRFNYGFHAEPPRPKIRWHPLHHVLPQNVPTETKTCEKPKNWRLSVDERKLMDEEKLFFWFSAIIEYVDSSGDKYETEMLWRYSAKDHFFAPWQDGGRNRNT